MVCLTMVRVLVVAIGRRQPQSLAPADVERAVGLNGSCRHLHRRAATAEVSQKVRTAVDVLCRLIRRHRAQHLQITNGVERELVERSPFEKWRGQRIDRRRRRRREWTRCRREFRQTLDEDLEVSNQVLNAPIVDEDGPTATGPPVDLHAAQAHRPATVRPDQEIVDRCLKTVGHRPAERAEPGSIAEPFDWQTRRSNERVEPPGPSPAYSHAPARADPVEQELLRDPFGEREGAFLRDRGELPRPVSHRAIGRDISLVIRITENNLVCSLEDVGRKHE